jgi:hypothetical protein
MRENKRIVKKGLCIGLTVITIISLFGTPVFALENWQVTLNFVESVNSSTDTVVFGENASCSDGQDTYDIPSTGGPPAPYIDAYFDAGLTTPYNKLWKDYRHYPGNPNKVWDLYVIAETTGEPTTDITISWDQNTINTTEYTYIDLYNGATKIADMRQVSTVIFTASSVTLYHLQIKCHVNQPPVVSDISDQTIAEGSTFATISFDDYVTDEYHTDAQMTWTYSGSSSLTVSIVDRVATITAPADWNGAETITFRATDPGASYDEDAATFTVTAVNDAPVVTDIPDQTIAEGASFTTITLDNYVSDVDNTDAEMTWSYSGNTELTVSITDRVATITTPGADWNGAETITFRATDPGALYDEDAAVFTVTAVNDPPTANPQNIETNENTSITITLIGNDIDGNIAKYTIASLPTKGELWNGSTQITTTPTGLSANTVEYRPDPAYSGSDSFTFTATDDGTPLPAQTSSPETISITIIKVHQIPVKYKWNLISLPMYDTFPKADIIVRYNDINYTWTEAVSANIVLNTIYNWQRGTTQAYGLTTSTLLPGEGYWMWAYHDCILLIANSTVGTGHITDFQSSWNIMGSPYNTTLAATNLITTYQTTDYTWTEATTGNIILGFIYSWNSTSQGYLLKTTFEPGEGYWMYAYYDCTLKQS